ncbi:tripartite tricarboxylate transporter permease, partial [Roseinatronobacter sp.]|uniref:tripartite tricarboxylate transporter permease n=1 Tax=Roseinatronobacter sp. TaxID=1945755 RepID=UPI0025D5C418
MFKLGIRRAFSVLYARLGQVSGEVLVPIIMIMAVIGAFAARGDPVDVYMMLGLGFIGFLMRRVGIPEAPLVITFLIAPLLEEILRRALLISRGDWGRAVGSALGIA